MPFLGTRRTGAFHLPIAPSNQRYSIFRKCDLFVVIWRGIWLITECVRFTSRMQRISFRAAIPQRTHRRCADVRLRPPMRRPAPVRASVPPPSDRLASYKVCQKISTIGSSASKGSLAKPVTAANPINHSPVPKSRERLRPKIARLRAAGLLLDMARFHCTGQRHGTADRRFPKSGELSRSDQFHRRLRS